MVEDQTEGSEKQKELDEILRRLGWVKKRMNHERVLQICLQSMTTAFVLGSSYIFLAVTLYYTLPKESAWIVARPFFGYGGICLTLSMALALGWWKLLDKFDKEELKPDSNNNGVGKVAGVDEKDSDVAADGHVAGDIVGTHQSPECKWWVLSFPRRTAPTLHLLHLTKYY